MRNLALWISLLSFISCGIPPFNKRSTPVAPIKKIVEETVIFNSTPSGGRVKLSSGESCRTPCSIRKELDTGFSVTISKEGYKTKKVFVSVVPSYPGSFTRKFKPNPVSAKLEPSWKKR